MKKYMDNLKIRKQKLIELLNNELKDEIDDINLHMYLLIKNNKLDSLISKLDDSKTITNTTSIVKKGFLTSEEQLLSLLYNLIHYVNKDFWFMKNHRSFFIEAIINSKEAENTLLSKKYFHNNNYLPFYKFHFQKIIINNFYNILKTIPKTEIISNFLKKHKIELDKINSKNHNDVEQIYNLLKLICICNNDRFNLFYILDDKNKNKISDMLITQFELLIEETNKKEKNIIALLND